MIVCSLFAVVFVHTFWCCVVGEVVAQIKCTVLMMPNGPMKITSGPIDLSILESEHKIEDSELQVISSVPW